MDGEIVCHHDVTLERMFGDPRHVDTVNTRELGGLRFGRRRRRATPLDGFSSALPDDVVPMLELKDWRFAEPARVHRLVDRLGARVADRRVGVITGHLSLLRAVQAAAPPDPSTFDSHIVGGVSTTAWHDTSPSTSMLY